MSMRVIVVLCQKDADSYRIWRYMQLLCMDILQLLHKVVSVEPVVDDFDVCSRILFIQDGVIFHELRRNIF